MRRIAIFAALVLGGCAHSAERSDEATNKEFRVYVLFTDSDGYTVKRFVDAGQYRYYVTPGPGIVVGRVGGKNARDVGMPTSERSRRENVNP